MKNCWIFRISLYGTRHIGALPKWWITSICTWVRAKKIGLVGESGCGKTTTMKMVMRTLDERGIKVGEGSKLLFGGEDILAMDAKALLDLRRRKISMISQSPMAALNPVFTIGQQMMDVLKYSGQFDKHDKKGMLDAARKAIDRRDDSGPTHLNSYRTSYQAVCGRESALPHRF